MSRPRHLRQLMVIVGAAVSVALLAVLLAVAEDKPPRGGPVIVCIDSTVSTDGVRSSYLPDLRAVARKAAADQAHFYAALCGANATGEVDWPVRRRFTRSYSSDSQAGEQASHQAEEVMDGREGQEGLRDLVAVRSPLRGTPLGEMLAVAARQCGQAGGDCTVYVFTDGEWADRGLKVSNGVGDVERREYVDAYLPQLSGLTGSTVNFVGVGYGTSMGEVRLNEAREIAALLVERARGTMGAWTTRL